MIDVCKVFLSSTGVDLQDWRDAAYEAIRLAGATCIRMEDFEADPRPPAEVCAAEVLGSSFLVGLIGFHYGGRVPPEKDRSFTQMEIETARQNGIDCFLYVAPDGSVPAVGQTGADLDSQTAFRNEILNTVTVGRPEHWTDKYRLALRILSVVFKRCRPDAPGIEQYAASLNVELLEKAEAAARARPEDVETVLGEKAAVEAKLADIELAYATAEETIAGMRQTIEQYGNDLGAERLARAEAALDDFDFDTADALLKEIEDDGELEIFRVANAAFQRGKIAEEQVRWADAAEHYSKAARLAPDVGRLDKAQKFHWRAGQLPEAARWADELVDLAKTQFGEDQPQTSAARNNLGTIYTNMGRYEDAEPLFRQALEIAAKTIGTAHPDYAVGLNNLAALLEAMGRHDEAELLFRQALEVDEKTIGTAHPEYAKHLSNLAALLWAMGRHDEAEPLYRQAMEIDAKTIGTAHPDYATDLNNLANLLRAMGRYDKAQPLYAQTMPILRGTLGDDHPNTRGGAANYARLLRAHFPDDPALAELEAAFGPDIGR